MIALTALVLATCLTPGVQDPPPRAPEAKPAKPDDGFKPDPKWKELGKDLWFDPENKQLVLRARVVLREGYLEHLLCLTRTKEHESVLATEAAPKMIHAGLILAVGEPGKGVRYQPEIVPPSGPSVAIEAEWVKDGKTRRIDARQLVK